MNPSSPLGILLARKFVFYYFFFNDTATTEIYTLSLHDALPISNGRASLASRAVSPAQWLPRRGALPFAAPLKFQDICAVTGSRTLPLGRGVRNYVPEDLGCPASGDRVGALGSRAVRRRYIRNVPAAFRTSRWPRPESSKAASARSRVCRKVNIFFSAASVPGCA